MCSSCEISYAWEFFIVKNKDIKKKADEELKKYFQQTYPQKVLVLKTSTYFTLRVSKTFNM